MRVSINLSEEMLQRVDQEAKRLGTSRGAMLTTWIGEKINNMDRSQELLNVITNNLSEQINDKLRAILEESSKGAIQDPGADGLTDLLEEQMSLLGKESK